jgi:hypothetical protein
MSESTVDHRRPSQWWHYGIAGLAVLLALLTLACIALPIWSNNPS